MAVPFERSIVCPVLIGRAAQLDALERRILFARDAHGQVALIVGEAGIGKSRLVAEIRARAVQQGFAILQGRCFEPDRALPYAPLLDLLHAFFANQRATDRLDSLRPLASDLVKVFPDLADLFPGLAATPALEPEQERRRVAQALVRLFVRAADQPLLIVVEDLHWSDDASLDVLLTLTRRIAAQPILLLLTYRDDERTPALEMFLAELDRERLATELALARLSRAEVDAMLRAIFDLRRAVRPEFLEALYATTEGNPFFVEEVLKALISAGEIFFADGQWDRKPLSELHIPRSVQVAVQRRLHQLSAEARELLTFAALIGRRFDFALLQALTGRDELTLMRLIKQLIAAQLVVEEVEDRFVFRHALTRQAVEADLLARERRALHRQIAQALEHSAASGGDAHLADLAEHCYAAGMWEQALMYARRAGVQAQALYAPRAAVEQFSRAIDAARRLALDSPADLYRARGQNYDVLGAFDAANEDYIETFRAARAAGDRMAEWQSLLDLGFLWTGRDYARASGHLQDALLLARAMGSPATLAWSLNRLGNWHANSERPLDARQYHQEALALFEQLDDRGGLATTLDLLGTTSLLGGDVFASAEYYQRAIAIFRELGDRQGPIGSLVMRSMRGASYVYDTVICQVVSLEISAREAEEALALARQTGWRAGEASVLMYMGLGLGARGAYERALQTLRLCLEIASEIEHAQWTMVGHWTLGALYLDLLALPAAREQLERALELAEQIGHTFSVRMAASFLAETYLAQGEHARAGALLAGIIGSGMSMQTLAGRRVWCAWAGWALASGDPAGALQIADRLVASAANLADGRVIPRLWQLRGEALAALDRKAEAEDMLRAAQAAARAQGALPLCWRIQIGQGKLALACRRRQQAEATFAAASALVADLAAGLPEAELRALFQRGAGARIPQLAPPSPRRATKLTFEGLTERERQVAALVAQGKSNRALADRLVVSERTIEKHIENILSKLGFTSRAQIAAWAVEKGLAAGIADPTIYPSSPE